MRRSRYPQRKFTPPAVRPRYLWTDAEIERDKQRLTALTAQPAASTPSPAPRPASLQTSPEPSQAPTTTKKRKPKEVAPTVYRMQFSPEGEFIGFSEPNTPKKEVIINVRIPHTQ